MKYRLYIILLLLFFLNIRVSAQTPVRTGPAPVEEITKAQVVVEANMDSIDAHKTYIYAMGLNNPLLAPQYEAWMKKYPENVNIPLSIGTVYCNAEMAQGREFLLKAAAIDPKNAKIWLMLSEDAFTRGQNDLYRGYIKKATLAEPLNAGYAYRYLASFKDEDSTAYKQKVLDFVKRFPTDENGAQGLYWLAEGAANANDRINYFEELRKLYPPKKFNWSSAGMIGLADAYLQTDPERALILINEMGDGKNWQIRKQVAEALIRINKFTQNQDYKQAIQELNKVKLPKFNYINDFIILKKAALLEKAGDVKAAYDSLSAKFAKLPTDPLYNTMELYGKEIGKTKERVVKDIDSIRNSGAIAAYPFELGLYTSNDKLNFKDLKGKVVLLTFWFPACSPCRAEFPHFQAVINKFKGENVVYVGVNVYPAQDPYVLPFMENTKFSFIPLRGSTAFALKNYGVQAEPENFLIDKDGKIIFKNFSIDNSNHRTLELMISSLLEKGQQTN